MNASIEKKLSELSKGNISQWKELPAYQKANRKWMDVSFEISLRILEILDEKGYSRADLATILKVSKQQVSKILSGQANLTLETISKLETALNVKLIDVLANVETDQMHETNVLVAKEMLETEQSEIIKDLPEVIKERNESFTITSELMNFTDFLENTMPESEKHQTWCVSRNPEHANAS